jgi:GNAT superfamily N-acetyltransferase
MPAPALCACIHTDGLPPAKVYGNSTGYTPGMDPREPNILDVTSASHSNLIQQSRDLLTEYGEFLQSRPEAAHVCFGSLAQETARLPMSYEEQGGGVLLAHSHDSPVGLVAWRIVPGPSSPHSWEIKRLWVRPAARGIGLGRRRTQAILDRARAAARHAVYLDTIPAAMPEALSLYLQMGFTPCAPYAGPAEQGVAYLVKNI